MSQLRKRRNNTEDDNNTAQDDHVEEITTDPGDSVKKSEDTVALEPGSFWLTRILFLRYLGFIYFIAFLISYNQNKELIGNNGLTPAKNYLLNGNINYC